MKRLIHSMGWILILSLLMTCGCSDATKNWSTADLGNCGTIKLPDNWTIEQKNDRYYIFNDDSSLVMAQSFSYCGIEDNQEGQPESNNYYTIQNLKCLTSAVLSNGAIYGTFKSIKDGAECEMLFLELGYDGDTILFVVDSSKIDIDYLKQIANTFVPS